MIVLYEDGDHSDLILKATSWLEHSGKFNVCVLAVNKRHEVNPTEDAKEFEQIIAEDNKHKEYLEQVGFGFNEIHLSEETGKSSEKYADLILSAINASQPDLVVTGATIGKFSFFNNSLLVSFGSITLSYYNCQTIYFSRGPSREGLVSEASYYRILTYMYL